MTDKTNDKYACQMTSEASRRYIDKMLQLGTKDELRAFVPATPLDDHLMFCVDRIDSPDGKRTYEFLIEYHTKRPSEGIYYGCRGITKEGISHKKQIEQFRNDWQMVQPVLTQQLDNNLPDYNAESRYRMTDNADNNTYWLFWISLRDDEDISEIGLRATHITCNVFREYIAYPDAFAEKSRLALASIRRKVQHQREPQNTIQPFTREAYENFVNSQPTEVGQFISSAIQKGWLTENRDFGQYALQFIGSEGHNTNVDFAVMIHTFYRYVLDSNRIPWSQIQQLFIDIYGTRFDNIKGQIAQAQNDTLAFWKETIVSLYVWRI